MHRYHPRVRLGEAYDGPAVPEGGWWTVHPAVLQHPVTGVPILYMNPWFTCGVVGMDDEGGGRLLARLFTHLSNPAFLYRHEWSPHDLVLWDNLAVMHVREPYEEAMPRVLCKWEFGLREPSHAPGTAPLRHGRRPAGLLDVRTGSSQSTNCARLAPTSTDVYFSSSGMTSLPSSSMVLSTDSLSVVAELHVTDQLVDTEVGVVLHLGEALFGITDDDHVGLVEVIDRARCLPSTD